ncbi:unnamed protein product, partial [Prorocentrum cordatum]
THLEEEQRAEKTEGEEAEEEGEEEEGGGSGGEEEEEKEKEKQAVATPRLVTHCGRQLRQADGPALGGRRQRAHPARSDRLRLRAGPREGSLSYVMVWAAPKIFCG